MHISKTVLLVGAVLLIGAGCAGTKAPTSTHNAAGTQPAGTPYVDDTPTVPVEALPVNDALVNDVDTPNPIAVGEPNPATPPVEVKDLPSAGTFETYSESKLARAETGNVVLFFHAAWCPSCRALESDINKNSKDIPSDLTILKLDYDTETALKKKYGVRSQHSLVQVDKDGTMINSWRGGNRLSDIVNGLQ